MNEQLLAEMQNAVKETISDKKIGVAFSGGVDSTLLAKLVKDMGYDVHLLTIGFQDSHDINFAKEVNQILNFHTAFQRLILKNSRMLVRKSTRLSNQITFPGMKIQLHFIMLQSLHKKMD